MINEQTEPKYTNLTIVQIFRDLKSILKRFKILNLIEEAEKEDLTRVLIGVPQSKLVLLKRCF